MQAARRYTGLFAIVVLTWSQFLHAAEPPVPQLRYDGEETYQANGSSFVRHRFSVVNRDQFPADMFAASPGLPPCGSNASAARSWVDLFDGTGRRLYGFCALASREALGSLWFALPPAQARPAVYVEVNDRLTKKVHRSNTVAGDPNGVPMRPIKLRGTVDRFCLLGQDFVFQVDTDGLVVGRLLAREYLAEIEAAAGFDPDRAAYLEVSIPKGSAASVEALGLVSSAGRGSPQEPVSMELVVDGRKRPLEGEIWLGQPGAVLSLEASGALSKSVLAAGPFQARSLDAGGRVLETVSFDASSLGKVQRAVAAAGGQCPAQPASFRIRSAP